MVMEDQQYKYNLRNNALYSAFFLYNVHTNRIDGRIMPNTVKAVLQQSMLFEELSTGNNNTRNK